VAKSPDESNDHPQPKGLWATYSHSMNVGFHIWLGIGALLLAGKGVVTVVHASGWVSEQQVSV
jgi:hypothetical protein